MWFLRFSECFKPVALQGCFGLLVTAFLVGKLALLFIVHQVMVPPVRLTKYHSVPQHKQCGTVNV